MSTYIAVTWILSGSSGQEESEFVLCRSMALAQRQQWPSHAATISESNEVSVDLWKVGPLNNLGLANSWPALMAFLQFCCSLSL